MEAVSSLGELSWHISHSHGDAGAFHATDPQPVRSATFHTVDRATLVLGSTQDDASVASAVASANGVEVVRRRSGGGAVLLVPGEFVWLDLVIPAGDPLWSDDVGRAMVWAGEAWQTALQSLGCTGEVHRGAPVSSPWSTTVCWAGIGTGELLAPSGGKLVGISQRRTRSWARFQTMCHLRWQPELVAALCAPPGPSAADLAPLAACVPSSAEAVTAALAAALP